MCSWCWGFAPIIKALQIEYKHRYTFSIVVGGLRTKGQMSWDKRSKAYLQSHWQQVAVRTGQPFSQLLFEKNKFEYDTYPACKAIVSIRLLYGEEEALKYLHTIQKVFYAKGIDITQETVLVKYVGLLGFDVERFHAFYSSKKAQILMEHDFAKARSMGANAFPSVAIIDSDGHLTCQKGYKNMNEMKKILGEFHA
jgi:putative protein-disulfide isomerase